MCANSTLQYFQGRVFKFSVGCKQPAASHDVSDAMTAPRERRADDNVELLPLKSMLVNNNNYREDEAYYPPAPTINKNPSSSNLYDYTLLSKRTPVSKRYLLFNHVDMDIISLHFFSVFNKQM